MIEKDIDWDNVRQIKDEKFPMEEDLVINGKKERVSYELGYHVMEYNQSKRSYYQLQAYLPFSFKSSWILTKQKWKKYAIERLKSELKKRYNAIVERDKKHKLQFAKFLQAADLLEDQAHLYATKLNHGNLHEKLNKKSIASILKKIDAMSEDDMNLNPDKCELTLDYFKAMLFKAKCSYCGITIKDIHTLSQKNKLYTKRARGYSIEIDQKDPYNYYSDENCIASCYWCNNAKTDEFSVSEFETIAWGINKIWNFRLGCERVIFPKEFYKNGINAKHAQK